MPKNKIPIVKFRRKRESKTNYKKRLAALKGKTPRLVVRKFNKNILAQIITFSKEGDKIEVAAYSKELAKYGWKHSKNNLPASYLVGFLVAKKAKTKKAILDSGMHSLTKGSKIYACLKGAIDGGMQIPHASEVLPSQDRIAGKHIQGKDFEKDFKDAKEKIIKG